MSQHVRDSLGGLFGSAEGADCLIQFYSISQDAETKPLEPLRLVGEPLPAHLVVLRCGSRRLRLLIDGWNQQQSSGGCDTSSAAKRRRVGSPDCSAPGSSAPHVPLVDHIGSTSGSWRHGSRALPELRVELGRDEELEPALAAIRFMYTGTLVKQQQQRQPPRQLQVGCDGGLEAGLAVAELLVLAHVAEALEVVDCAEACYVGLVEMLQQPGASSTTSNNSGSSSCPASSLAPVLELYSFRHLLPSPEHQPVLSACRESLLRNWEAQLPAATGQSGSAAKQPPTKAEVLAWLLGGGDAVRIINDPALLRQWVALPAAALEGLLQSDYLSTDDEATVVLLVETWVAEREKGGSAATKADKARVRRQLRLVNCNMSYMFDVLPQLPWLGPNPTRQAAFLARCHGTDRARWKELGECTGYDTSSPWYGTPRPQSVPPEGVSYKWDIDRAYLLARLGMAGQEKILGASFAIQDSGMVSRPWMVAAQGYEWGLLMQCKPGDAHATMALVCGVPAALKEPAGTLQGATTVRACVEVPDGASGTRQIRVDGQHVKLGDGWDMGAVLPLETAGAAAVGQVLDGADASAALLAPWAKLMGPDGKIAGTFTVFGAHSE